MTRTQLLDLGFTRHAIQHRIMKGRLHPVWRGVYAVGRPGLSRQGVWMAAVLSCGPAAVLSHRSAAALWEIGSDRRGRIDVSVPASVARRRKRILVHRRAGLAPEHSTRHKGIPVTAPIPTLVDLAACLPRNQLEAAINEADKRDLIDSDELRFAVDRFTGWLGVRALRTTLDRHTFALTDSELERRFLPIARSAGLPSPKTGCLVNGFKVTSTGRAWGWWSKPTACAITALLLNRQGTDCATRCMSPRASRRSGSPTPK